MTSPITQMRSLAILPEVASALAGGHPVVALESTIISHGMPYPQNVAMAVEVEGIGRAAFAMVANCSPYTYAGRLGLRFAPDATFEGGLDVVAPVEVRARAIPRLTVQALRGRPGGGVTLVGHDLDRIVIRCDEPMPAQVDGEDIGDLREAEIVAERDVLTVIT